ncbi:conserved Plasmodium protein, unknown function [Plasmodium ovale curtisi]|uniref:Uncharacterized protein n=1 Tax=Plasmodium ovale curtisi TaxID=864141 RepID=A0A1A8VJX8_PLAOA|nr:conserved Plasmodium protein, unknown function [Plasmodium ovale curtisi]SBS82169.1 conserved Plasmodium protein, unknown function [Plasmodium ovale curtisi]
MPTESIFQKFNVGTFMYAPACAFVPPKKDLPTEKKRRITVQTRKMYMRERKMYGNNIPKSLSSKISKNKVIQKNICANYKTIKIIDIYENLPFNQMNNERTKIKEIILANDVIVVLLISGISRAYDIVNGRFLCEINPNTFSVVHTIVYNSYNNTLIVAYASFPAHLQCKVIDCNDLKIGRTNSSGLGILFGKVFLPLKNISDVKSQASKIGQNIFLFFRESYPKSPCVFRILRIGAANLNANSYTFWDMRTYERVFEIEEEFQEIRNGKQMEICPKNILFRVSDGLVAMFKQPLNNTIPLALFDIENGKRLVETVISILPRKEMQFLELLVTKLLIKQEGSSLRIYDLLKSTRQKVKNTYAFQPTAFVFYDVRTEKKWAQDSSSRNLFQNCHPSPINGKVYNNEVALSFSQKKKKKKKKKKKHISKKFFTISNDLIEFWDLDSSMLRKMYAIYVPGLRDPDLCNHSLTAEILCLYSSSAFEKIRKYESLFKYVDSGETYDQAMHVEGIRRGNKNALYKKKILYNNIQNDKLKSDISRENFNFGALLFFSLSDGEFLNYISENVCGNSVEVLTSNNSMTVLNICKRESVCTIICGDDKGFVRILRNNPKFDDFEIRSAKMANSLYDKGTCNYLFSHDQLCIEDEGEKTFQIKRKKRQQEEKGFPKRPRTREPLGGRGMQQ